MSKVKVNIAGNDYTLSTDESETYMLEIAGRVDRAMRDMLENPRVSITQAAVLSALVSEDTAEKALRTADNMRAQMKEYLDDNSRARQECERLKQENSLLRQKLALKEQAGE